MSQEPTQPPTPANSNTPETPPPKKRRKWPFIVGGLVVLLLLLVLLLPTIASLGPIRSMVVGQINQQINGSVEIGGWSLGWFSPISLSNVKVYDEQKRLILDVPSVKLGISLSQAIRSNFALGNENEITVASFLVNVDETGKTNLEKLPRAKSTHAPAAAPSAPPKLPDVSGKFKITFAGTVEGSQLAKPIYVRQSTANVTITDINQPIENQVDLVYQVGDGKESHVQLAGSLGAIKNNVLDLEHFASGQQIKFSNVDMAAAGPFQKLFPQIEGLVNGGVEIKATGLTGLSASGEISVDGLVLAGGVLGADSFKTPKITIPVNVTRTELPGDSLIKFENVGLKMNQLNVAVTGQVTEKTLLNLLERKPPGADGGVTVTADITDLKDLASQLKSTLQLQQGVAITGGMAHEQLAVALSKDKITITQDLKAQASGTRDGKPIEIKPITFSAGATAIPNGKPIPEVRDVKLAVNSDFVTVTGGGESLAKIAISGKLALDTLAAEVSQFVDMQKIQLQGSGDFAFNTDGDLTNDSAPILITSSANFQNIRVSGVASQQINQDRLTFQASGKLLRAANVPQKVDQIYLSVVSGDPNAPLLDVEATSIVDLQAKSVPWFELKKCTITSLPKLQQQYGGMVPALATNKISIDSGALYATAAGTFDGTTLTFARPAGVSMTALTISKDQKPILAREVIRATINGNISTHEGIAGNFSDLSVTSDSKLVTLTKSGDGPLTFKMIPKGPQTAIQGNGAMTVAADLKRLVDLAQAFSGTAAVSADQPQLRSGQLDGTLTLAKATQPQTDLKFDGKISSLTISTAANKIVDNEQITVALNASAPDDLKAQPVTATGKIGSSFVNVNLTDVKVSPNGAMLDMLLSAAVEAQVPDVPKLYAVMNSVGTGPADPTPLQVTSGGALLKLNIARDLAKKMTTVTVSDARVSRLALKRGTYTYAFDPANQISFKLAASIEGTATVDAIRVQELSGDARIAQISMPQPIVITGLSGNQPSYQGTIAAQGSLDSATPLLAVLQNAPPMPYAGSYVLSQNVGSTGSTTALKGSVDITNFKVLPQAQGEAGFSEPKISIRNDLSMDLTQKKISVQTLTLAMPQSQALGVNLVGGIDGWSDKRQISPGTKVDLSYDLAKLWTIVRPMLAADTQTTFKDLKVTGKYQKTFTIAGAFPAGVAMGDSFRSLSAEGGFSIDLLDVMGLTIQKLEPQVKMTRGVVVLSAPVAQCNEGTLDINGIAADMRQADPVVSIPRNKKLLTNVKLNPLLASSLGKFASVIFSNTKSASGLADVTAVEFNQVPVGALVHKQTNARAKILISVRDLALDSFPMQLVGGALGFGENGIHGSITNGTMALADGQATSDISLQLDREGQRVGRGVVPPALRFAGAMGLEKLDLRDFKVVVPQELVPSEVRRSFPNGLTVPLTGTAEKPGFDIGKVIAANLPGAILGNLGGNGNNGNGGNNPVGDILNQLGGGNNNQQNPPNQPRPRNRER